MTTDVLQSQASDPIPTPPFGLRLQYAREALGIELKDAAAQLRLNERIIAMLETNCYATDLPPTFVRGYIRSYGKLLQIPDHEIKAAIEPIQSQSITQLIVPTTENSPAVTSNHYFVQFFTYLITLTLIALVGIWWYSHTTPPLSSEKPLTIPMPPSSQAIAPPAIVNQNSASISDTGNSIKSSYPTANIDAATKKQEATVSTPPKTVAGIAAPTSATANENDDDE